MSIVNADDLPACNGNLYCGTKGKTVPRWSHYLEWIISVQFTFAAHTETLSLQQAGTPTNHCVSLDFTRKGLIILNIVIF